MSNPERQPESELNFEEKELARRQRILELMELTGSVFHPSVFKRHSWGQTIFIPARIKLGYAKRGGQLHELIELIDPMHDHMDRWLPIRKDLSLAAFLDNINKLKA